MGCVSSKHLKKQASMDGWISPAARMTTPRAHKLTTDYSVECYHRHFVSLTSSSYGLLKVEPPKPAEVKKNHDRGGVVAGSLNEMYGKLRSLEVSESAHTELWCEVSSMPDTLKPCLEKNTSSPSAYGSPHGWRINSAELVVSETINVGDMMRGLEEAAPSRGLSPAKQALGMVASPQTKAIVSRQHNKKIEKGAMAFHTVEEVNSLKNSPTITHYGLDEDDNEFGKENTMPCHGQYIMAPPLKSATSTRSPLGNTPLSQVSQPLRRESIVSRKVAHEKASDTVVMKSSPVLSPGLSPTPATTRAMKYAASNGKVKLTLHTLQNKFAGTITPPSFASRSMSRRVVMGGSIPSTEPNSPLFDPDLVASYEKALENLSEDAWNAQHHVYTPHERHHWTAAAVQRELSEDLFCSNKYMTTVGLDRRLYDPFECFKVMCPPGGDKTVVLYTTTLRGIRKTFEDCNTVRGILQSFGLSINERDVSMHLEFLNELRELMGRVVSVPRLFIKGWYIGGIEEVVKLHEDGKLSELVEGLPKEVNGGNCDGCGGVRFVPCLECSGSCKIRNEDNSKVIRCPDCNENGLIQCPICT